MRKSWKALLAVVALLVGSSAAQAQEPVAVISVSSYNGLLGDVAAVGEVAGKPGLDKFAEALITLQTGGKGLVGIDKTKPWGVQVTIGEAGPTGVTFLPVTDLDALLGALVNTVGEAEDVGDGVLALSDAPQPVFIKKQGNWAFIGQTKEALATLPPDPVKLLDGLNEEYAVAARVYVQNIPEPLRKMAVEQLRVGFKGSLQQAEGESDADFEIRENAGTATLKQLEQQINEMETLTVGWAVDRESKETYIDIAQTAVPGTMLAKKFASFGPSTSTLGGFATIDGAAASLLINADTPLSETDKQRLDNQINSLRDRTLAELEKDGSVPDDAKKIIKEAISDIFDVIAETAASGTTEAGFVVTGEPFNAVAGAHVTDGKKIDAALKKIGEVAAKDPNAPKINWDAETYEGFSFHHLSTTAPDENAKRLMGDTLQIAAATSADGVFVAAGADATGAIKQVIDASKAAASTELPVAKFVLSLGEVMKIAAKAQPDDPNVQMMAGLLSQMPGNDQITVTASEKENGNNFRLSVDEGVIKLIGAAAANAGAAGGGF